MILDPKPHKPERKRRKDAAQPRYEDRDYYVLRWIGQQGIIRFDQLQQLLGRESPGQETWDLILSPSATRNAINRWETKHLVNAAYIIPKEPKYYWLSTAGLQLAELHVPHYSPKLLDMADLFACNQIRLYIEELNRVKEDEFGDYDECYWESRREIQARTPGHENMHLQSGIFRTEKRGALAIEVITANNATMETSMQSYLTPGNLGFSEIWYFAPSALLPAVEKTRTKLKQSAEINKIFLYKSDAILVPLPRPKRQKRQKKA